MTGGTPLLSLAFVLVYVAVPVLALVLIRAAGVGLRQVSIITVTVYYYLAFAYAGLPLLYLGWFPYIVDLGIRDRFLVFQVLIYDGGALLALLAGYALVRGLVQAPVDPEGRPAPPLGAAGNTAVLALVGVSVLVTIAFLREVPDVALLQLVAGQAAFRETILLRSQMTNDFSGSLPYHYYSLFFAQLLPFCVYVLYGQVVVRRGVAWRALFVAVFLIAAAANLMDMQKAPLVWLIGGCFLMHFHARNRPVPVRAAWIGLAGAAGVVMLLYWIFLGLEGRPLGLLARSALERVLVGGIEPAYFYLDLFPRHREYLFGLSFPSPRGLLPWEPVLLTQDVSSYMFPSNAALGIVGSAPAPYWAELYANFGPVGPFAFSPVIGAAIAAGEALIARLEHHVVRSALVAWASVHFMLLATTSFSNYLFDTSLALILVTALSLLMVPGWGRLRYRSLVPRGAR